MDQARGARRRVETSADAEAAADAVEHEPGAVAARVVRRRPRGAAAREAADMEALGRLPEWDLTHLYPSHDAPEFAADLARAAQACATLAATWRGRVAERARAPDGPARLAEAIDAFEALEDLMGRLMSYASLVYAADTTSPVASKFHADVQDRLTAASSEVLFFTLELNRLDADTTERLLAAPELARVRPWLADLARDKPHQLDDSLERLFHEKAVTGRSAWNRLFDETIASLRFPVDGPGRPELPLEPTLNRLQSADGEVRRLAASALATVLGRHSRTFTLITNTLAKDKEIADRWRGFRDVADARHLSNRVEGEVVDALARTVRDSYPRLSHRYYALKARWFGRDTLDHWDRNAPLPRVDRKPIAWAEARDLVLDAYSGFSPRMANVARRFFDERWIDAPSRPGKAPGAFAHPTVPSAHPYVLLNYLGKPRDVMTLAHELGHGVHQVLAGPQGALMAPTPLTMAETASVFGEMLTFRALLDRTRKPAERKALLASKVEDMLNTVVRQIAFYEFERRIHLARREGELTTEDIGRHWLDVQRASLGPAIALKDGYETFWSYIPHFVHSPFYVYAYAFGDCLVNALYAVYEGADDGFADRYLDMLAAGGSRGHAELLAPFGLDARDPSFWEGGVAVISRMIDELEQTDA